MCTPGPEASVAARYHFRELAHAEALRVELGPVPSHCDCYVRGCRHKLAYETWHAASKQIATWLISDESAVRTLLCRKCGGRGITQWRHRCGGICFQCNGYGWSAKGRKQPRWGADG